MKSETQTGCNVAVLRRNPYAHLTVIDIRFVENRRSSRLKPGHGLCRGTEQGSFFTQLPKQSDIEGVPKPFRRNAAVMPIHCEHAPLATSMLEKRREPRRGFIIGETKIVRIKQCRIHNVQGKFQEASALPPWVIWNF